MSKINNQNCECPITLPKFIKQSKPIFTQDICKKHVPLLLCNYKKQNQLNKSIFERNFAKNLSKPIIPIRPNYDICNNQTDLNKDNIDYNNDLKNKIVSFNNIKTQFVPGKGQGINFLKNIDIDSELKSLNHKNTLCNVFKYNPLYSNKLINDNATSSNTTNVNNPKLLDNPYNQNYLRYRYNDKINNTNIDKYLDKNKLYKNADYIDDSQSIVGIKYIRNSMNDNNYCSTHNNCTNMSEFRRCNNNNRSILVKTNMENCPKMQVGPERKNHTCENLWSNVTRRKHISP